MRIRKTRSSPVIIALVLAAGVWACGDGAAPPAPGDERADVVQSAGADAEPTASGETDELVLSVDDLGFFVSERPVDGEWYAGPGVRGVVQNESGLAGRLEGERATLWTRDADGSFVGVTPRRVAAGASLAAEVGAAMSVAFGGRFYARFTTPMRCSARPSMASPPRHEPVAQPAEPRTDVLPPGTPLLSWAPADTLAVRFRSIEAALRFADVADRLAQRLGFARGAARDYGSLRMTLHHLLLPSIWRANPGGRKGVAECLLILRPTQTPGSLDAALVLRIIDPELHRMETVAGVALETSAPHRWRPDGDPFPARRVRSAVRVVAGDCEIVATNAALLEHVVAEGTARSADADQASLARRAGLPAPSGSDRALSLRFPTTADVEFRLDGMGSGLRTREGLAALASRFAGLEMDMVGVADDEWRQPDVVMPWSDVVAACVDTSVVGARISVRMRDSVWAAALGERLRAPGPPPDKTSALCGSNLLRLVALGMVEPRASDVAERNFVWLGWRPVCPDGGTYRFHPVTGEPRCTLHGTTTDTKVGPGLPPSPITDVKIDGSLVTFLLRIDWSRGR